MRYLFLITLLCTQAWAVTPRLTNPPRERLAKNAQVTVTKYFVESDVFELTLSATPDVGPNYATPEDLHDALGLLNPIEDFRKRTIKQIGTEFVLRRELLLLWPNELKARSKKAKR